MLNCSSATQLFKSISQPLVYHDELKKSLNLTVTPTGARELEEIAQELGLKSKSELVDQIGRRVLIVSPNPAVKQDTEEPAD